MDFFKRLLFSDNHLLPPSSKPWFNVEIGKSGPLRRPAMTLTTESWSCLFSCLFRLCVTPHTLVVKGLPKVYPCHLRMAMCTSHTGITLLKFALIQDVLAVLILVMAGRTREISCHVGFVRERHGWPLFLFVALNIVDDDLFRLGTRCR